MAALSTDAFAFLNIRHPLCAWATYRGALISPPDEPGNLTVWCADLLRADDPVAIAREIFLEEVRKRLFPERISRLRGIFCFLDLKSAEAACSWATSPRSHFRPEFLAELHLGEWASPERIRLDANWISHAPIDETGKIQNVGWALKYWSGVPHRASEPIWEILIRGRAVILGTALRERAYDQVKVAHPKSLMFLEIARVAEYIGSDLGNSFASLREDGDHVALKYYLDMRDATNKQFLDDLEEVKQSGYPINWADIAPHSANDSFGSVPDLMPYGFRRPKIEMPHAGPAKEV